MYNKKYEDNQDDAGLRGSNVGSRFVRFEERGTIQEREVK